MGARRTAAAFAAVLVAGLAAAAGWPVAGAQAGALSAGGAASRSSAPAPALRGTAAFLAAPGLVSGPRADVAAVVPSASLTGLSGVFCTARASCWAVGERASGGAELNQVLRWRGSSWRKVSVPDPGGTAAGAMNQLFAVRCLTASNCWAVGEYLKDGAYLAEALHWNGGKWSGTATPSPAGHRKGDMNELFDVACTAPANCWAVGDIGRFRGTITTPVKLQDLALHWNGAKWTMVRTPHPAGTSTGHVNSIFGVRCISATDCNAVGDDGTTASAPVLRNQALHWNGTKWSQAHTPNPGGTHASDVSELESLGCGSPTSCWAAGLYGSMSMVTTTSHDEILHWNGKRWTRAKAPNPGHSGSMLFGAVCVSAPDCWAVGNYRSAMDGVINQAVHWNGTRWSLVHTPDPGGTGAGGLNVLLSARCTAWNNCWAVGSYESAPGTLQNEILHWNGTNWTIR